MVSRTLGSNTESTPSGSLISPLCLQNAHGLRRRGPSMGNSSSSAMLDGHSVSSKPSAARASAKRSGAWMCCTRICR